MQSDDIKLISGDQIEAIKKVTYFAESQYANLDIKGTLEFFIKRFVTQITDFIEIKKRIVIADIGAGFGWLSMAFAFTFDFDIIAVDSNRKRLEAGKEIARILNIESKIDWRVGSLGSLPIDEREVDIVYCIEVLEHVYGSVNALQDLCRISKDLIVLTTPNLWFPIIAHDTRLPFCHWLPINIRKQYAKLFNKEHLEYDNLFWSPLTIKKCMPEFVPISRWLHYDSYKKYLETFPFYLPYGSGKWVNDVGMLKNIYYYMISKLGEKSHYFSPSLSYVFKRKIK